MSHRTVVTALLAILLSGCQSPTPQTAVRVSDPAPPANAADRSPWQDAKSRGVVFRGVGNEPGWWVEVGAGATPRLAAALDYGERKLQVDRLQVESDGLGYSGTTTDRAAVRLVLSRAACSDGMSDERYALHATLSIDERRYEGCGRFLSE